MTFLNESGKSGVPRESTGGRAEGALRGVRARRDADEAGQYFEPYNKTKQTSLVNYVTR